MNKVSRTGTRILHATLAAGLLAGFLLARASASDHKPAASTQKMAERLQALRKSTDVSKNVFLNAERAARFEAMARNSPDAPNRFAGLIQAAIEYANAGKPDKAIALIDELRKFEAAQKLKVSERTHVLMRRCEATAYMRMGENDNCCASKSPDACLVPIRGGGLHTNPRGSRGAIDVLTQCLNLDPDDLSSLWLLNIAYMTLGEYPDAVPEKWRIPPSHFASDYDIKNFPDIAASLSIDVEGLAGGAIMEDFDGDGLLDMMMSSMGMTDQLRLFKNAGDGTFPEVTEAAGLIGELGGLNICQADYNNDGHIDVYVLRGAWMLDQGHLPDSLLKNNGDGTFTDVTEEAGLLSFHPSQAGTWGDFDGDGWLDLFVGNEHTDQDPHPCELFRNNRDGTFTECAAQVGITERGYVKGATWGDYDNDGRLDLYVSRLDYENLLYHNDGPAPGASDGEVKLRWKFTEVGKAAGVTLPIKSFPTWFFDYDNDGWLDLFVGSYDINEPTGDLAAMALGKKGWCESTVLYRNNRDGTFKNVSVEAKVDQLRIPMGANFGDLDNDGWLDFYLGTGNPDLRTLLPNRMLRNNAGKNFQDVTTSGNFGHLQKGHGVAFGDIDNDGDQDIFVVMGGAFEGDKYRRLFFLNPGHGNHWITLRCVGVKANRFGIDARIKITVETENGARDIHDTVNSGGSFGASSLQQEIGLGNAKSIRSLSITWPGTRTTDTYTDVPMDRTYEIREGGEKLVPVEVKRVDLARFAPR